MRHWIEYALLRIIITVVGVFPRRAAWAFAGGLANVIRLVGLPRMKIAVENLRASFPNTPDRELNRIAIASVRNLLQTTFEISFLARKSIEKIESDLTIYNLKFVHDLLQQHRRVILLSAHYGNWELAALSGAVQIGVPCTIIGKPQRNAYVNRYLNRMRERFGNHIVPMEGGIRSVIQTLETNGSVALLADQSGTSRDVFVPFFGRPAATTKAVAALSLKLDVPIIVGLARRRSDLHYEMEFVEVPRSDLQGYTEANVKMLTARHVQTLEMLIRRCPEQWLWMHRRWKHLDHAS